MTTGARGGESHGVSGQEAKRGEYQYVLRVPFYSTQHPNTWEEAIHLRHILSLQLNFLPAMFMVCLVSDFKSDPGDNED